MVTPLLLPDKVGLSSCHAILSELHVHDLAAAAIVRSEPMPLLPRNKLGEPLKSSLKAKLMPTRGSWTVITDPVSLSPRSAPTTPAHKGVRFHSQFVHVKLFLTEQKPLAVSRDGSPTDTSGRLARSKDMQGVISLSMVCLSIACILAELTDKPYWGLYRFKPQKLAQNKSKLVMRLVQLMDRTSLICTMSSCTGTTESCELIVTVRISVLLNSEC